MVNNCLLVGPVFNIGGGPLHTVRPPKVLESGATGGRTGGRDAPPLVTGETHARQAGGT
jgi:hypothetical protein